MVSIGLFAQQTYHAVQTGNLTGYLNSNGLLFDSSGNPGLYFGALSLVKSAGIWISAKDDSGRIRVAAHNVLGSVHDFWSGPLEVKSGAPANVSVWNKVYPMSKGAIDYHIKHYKDAGYLPAQSIANWPGSSDSPYAKILAPFVDVKENNLKYEPLSGDYPYIFSDALVYSISNDRYAGHAVSNALPLGVEIHTTIYGFTSSDSFLKNSLLVRYEVYNRSGRDYKNFRLSAVTNFRIGDNYNEYLGTDVGQQALFAINDTTEATFRQRLVSTGCMAFNRKISSTMYFKNDTNKYNGVPVNGMHFYNLMQGKWKDGKSLSYGSDGIDGSGKARFVYPYTSDHSHGDTMWSEYGNDPGNRIGIMNCDSVELKNGNAGVFDFVYFHVDEKFNNIKQIQSFCLNIRKELGAKNLLSVPQVFSTKKTSSLLFPNPLSSGDKLNIKRNLGVAMDIRILDLNGREVCNFNLHGSENSIILPANLVNGLYFIELKTLNTVETQTININ